MFNMFIVSQQGLKFNANLLKLDKVIGGIGGDTSGMFINMNEELTLEEYFLLVEFAKGIHPLYLTLPLSIKMSVV